MTTIKFKRTKEAVAEVLDSNLDVITPATDAEYVEVKTKTETVDESISEQALLDEILGIESQLANRKAMLKSLQSFKTKDVAEGDEDFVVIKVK